MWLSSAGMVAPKVRTGGSKVAGGIRKRKDVTQPLRSLSSPSDGKTDNGKTGIGIAVIGKSNDVKTDNGQSDAGNTNTNKY